jgi:hypothetical protein
MISTLSSHNQHSEHCSGAVSRIQAPHCKSLLCKLRARYTCHWHTVCGVIVTCDTTYLVKVSTCNNLPSPPKKYLCIPVLLQGGSASLRPRSVPACVRAQHTSQQGPAGPVSSSRSSRAVARNPRRCTGCPSGHCDPTRWGVAALQPAKPQPRSVTEPWWDFPTAAAAAQPRPHAQQQQQQPACGSWGGWRGGGVSSSSSSTAAAAAAA